MNTSTVTNPTPLEDFFKPFLKLLISLVCAFVGFSFTVIGLWLVLFLVMGIRDTSNVSVSIPNLLIGGTFFVFGYGIITSIASATPFFALGVPAAFIGWKLRLIRWWTCLVGGALLSISPMMLIVTIVTIGRSLGGNFPAWKEIIETAAGFLALGLCGGVGGLCFWLTLRFLRFPDIDGPIFSTQPPK